MLIKAISTFYFLHTEPLTVLLAVDGLLLPSAQFGCLMSNQGVITGTKRVTVPAFVSKGSLV